MPLDGQATLDVSDIHELELAVRQRAMELGVSWPWYVELKPTVDEPQEKDTALEPDFCSSSCAAPD